MSPTALSSTMLKERIARGFLLKGWAFLECSFVGVGGAWGDDRVQRRGNSRQPIRNPGRMTTLFCYFFSLPLSCVLSLGSSKRMGSVCFCSTSLKLGTASRESSFPVGRSQTLPLNRSPNCPVQRNVAVETGSFQSRPFPPLSGLSLSLSIRFLAGVVEFVIGRLSLDLFRSRARALSRKPLAVLCRAEAPSSRMKERIRLKDVVWELGGPCTRRDGGWEDGEWDGWG